MKKINVLFENKSMLVLDKPAGVSVHADGKVKEETISDYILKNYKKIKGVGENIVAKIGGEEVLIERPGIVHRLDKDTSGCLLIAKNQEAFENLKGQFQDKKIKKEYIALVWGWVKYETGIIDGAIARSKSDFRKKEIVKVIQGDMENFRGVEREALTRYKVLERKNINGEKVTLVAFYPETGRTHQIRIHSKSIGHPIVGDHLYGPVKYLFEKKMFGKNPIRQLLHAKSVTFENPLNGELLRIESPIPKDLESISQMK